MESSWDNTSTILEKNKEGGRGITVANSYRELKHALVAASAFRSAVHLRLAPVPITVTGTFSAQNTFDFQSRSLSLSPLQPAGHSAHSHEPFPSRLLGTGARGASRISSLLSQWPTRQR